MADAASVISVEVLLKERAGHSLAAATDEMAELVASAFPVSAAQVHPAGAGGMVVWPSSAELARLPR